MRRKVTKLLIRILYIYEVCVHYTQDVGKAGNNLPHDVGVVQDAQGLHLLQHILDLMANGCIRVFFLSVSSCIGITPIPLYHWEAR